MARHVHIKVLSRILYMTDLTNQFADVSEGHKEHASFAKQEEKAAPPNTTYGKGWHMHVVRSFVFFDHQTWDRFCCCGAHAGVL